MSGFLSGAQLKNKAKDCLDGHYGILIGAGIAVNVISFFALFLFAQFHLLSSNTPTAYLLSCAIRFLVSVFTGVFQAGITLLVLKCACGNKPAFSDIFYGFSHHLQTALGISLLLQTVGLIPTLACRIPYLFYLSTGENRFLFIICVSLLLSLVIYVPVSLCLSQCFYLMLDFPNKSVPEILSLSVRIMKGRKARLFYLELSFLPLILLGCLSVIGLLWVVPYMRMAMALFYLDIMKPEQKN